MNKPAKDSIDTWAAKRWPSSYFSMWLEEDDHYHAWMERRGVFREGRGTTQKKALIAANEALKAAEQSALQPPEPAMTLHVDSMAKSRGSSLLVVHALDKSIAVVVTERGRTSGSVLADKASVRHLIGLLKSAAKKAGIW